MSTSGLARYLIKEGLLSESDCHLIARDNGNTGAAFAKVVVSLGILSEEKLAQFLVQKTKLPMIPHNQFCTVKPGAESALTLPLIKTLEVIPVELHNDQLTVAMADPLDQDTLQQLRFFTNFRIKPVIATFTTLYKSLENLVQGFSPEKTTLQKLLALYTPKHVTEPSADSLNMALRGHQPEDESVNSGMEEPDEGFWDDADAGTEPAPAPAQPEATESSLGHDDFDEFDEFEQGDIESGLDDFEDESEQKESSSSGISQSIIDDEDFPLDSDESQAVFAELDLDDPLAADPLPELDPELLPGAGDAGAPAAMDEDEGLESWDDVMGEGDSSQDSPVEGSEAGEAETLPEGFDDQLWDDQGEVTEAGSELEELSEELSGGTSETEGDLEADFGDELASEVVSDEISEAPVEASEQNSDIVGLDSFFDDVESPEPVSGSDESLKAPTQLAGDEIPEELSGAEDLDASAFGDEPQASELTHSSPELVSESELDETLENNTEDPGLDEAFLENADSDNADPDLSGLESEESGSDDSGLDESMEAISEAGDDASLDSFLDDEDLSGESELVSPGSDLASSVTETEAEGGGVALAVETESLSVEEQSGSEVMAELEELGHETAPDQDEAIDQLSADMSQLADDSLDLETVAPADESPLSGLSSDDLTDDQDQDSYAKKHELGVGFLNHALAGVSLAMSPEKAKDAMAQGMTKAGIKKGLVYNVKDDQVIYVSQWGHSDDLKEELSQIKPELSTLPEAKPESLWVKLVDTPNGLESLAEDGCDLMAHWGPETAKGQGLTLASWDSHGVGHEGLQSLSGGLMDRFIKKSA